MLCTCVFLNYEGWLVAVGGVESLSREVGAKLTIYRENEI